MHFMDLKGSLLSKAGPQWRRARLTQTCFSREASAQLLSSNVGICTPRPTDSENTNLQH